MRAESSELRVTNCRAGVPVPAELVNRRAGRLSCHPRHDRRGQSLILVVLILLAVAALAALFVALIAATQARTGRQANVIALKNIAEAGIRYADYQLTYSAEGADWRPVPPTILNPYPYEFGTGEYRLTLTYNPQAGDSLSRFIKIECVAKLRGSRFFKHTLVAYKPILLADHLRFITNKDRSSLPAVLGVPGVAQGTSVPFYKNKFWGPIRANSVLEWNRSLASGLAVYLVEGSDGVYPRMDNIETASAFMLGDGLNSASVYLWNSGTGTYDGPYTTYASSDANFDVAVGLGDGVPRYVDGLNEPDKNGLMRVARFLEPPSLNTADPSTGQSRYLLLTRDSGTWQQDGGGNWYNTGIYGYGKGIYIDNLTDIQYAHNLAALRNEWMNPQPDNDPFPDADDDNGAWDRPAWSYAPPGVEIILHPDGDVDNDGTADYTYPVVQLLRDDGNWRTIDGSDSGSPLIYMAYPLNGVIYAEGNVRVAGILPPATAAGLPQYVDTKGTVSPADDDRYYDLTIVSGGTIYIEGDLMRPDTYLANAGQPTLGEARNSRLALLARDHVCLNMTAFGARYYAAGSTANLWDATNQAFKLTANTQVLAFTFRSFQPTPSPLIYLRHTGILQPGQVWNDSGVDYFTAIALAVNGSALQWGAGGTTFAFNPNQTPSANLSERVFEQPPQTQWEASVRPPAGAGVAFSGSGAINSLGFTVADSGVNINDYLLAGYQVLPSRINIDALIYAQEGSWFVLPGPWFNGSWAYTGNAIATDPVDDTAYGGVPSFRMALGSIPLTSGVPQPVIIVNGAITESHTASLGDAHDYLSKWSGPGALGALVNYAFDSGLRFPMYRDAAGNNLVRLPKLPCPPGLILWEEQ